MTSTLRFVVTVTLTWCLFFLSLVLAAHAAPLHGCGNCTSTTVISVLIIVGASIGACLGFLAAALFHSAERWEK
jgi:type III secretory pathway component EscT